MIKDLTISNLNDVYGKLLTSKQTELIKFFYDDDLSLGEIAENEGITRQAAHDAIAKGVAALKNYESILKVEQTIETLKNINCSMAKEDILSAVNNILEQWE